MVDTRRRYNDNKNKETVVSVQGIRKEFQPASGPLGERGITNDEDETFVSVKDRRKTFQSTKLDARQDDEDEDDDDEIYMSVMDRYKEFQQYNLSISSMRDTSSITSASRCSNSVFAPVASSPLAAANPITSRNKLPFLKLTKARSMVSVSPSNNIDDQNCFLPLTVSLLNKTDIGFSSSPKDNSSAKDGFQYGDVSLKRVEKPIEDRWRNLAKKPIEAAAIQHTGDDNSCRLSLSSIIPRGNKDDETNAWSKRRMSLSARKLELLKHYQDPHKDKINTSSSSSPTQATPNTISSLTNYHKPQPLTHRSKSLPKFVGTTFQKVEKTNEGVRTGVTDSSSSPISKAKQKLSLLQSSLSCPRNQQRVHSDESISDHEKYQNDLAAALKKVGPPIEERWKLTKNNDQELSETSKPLFASIKLKIIETPANATSAAASRFADTLQYIDDPTIQKIKQKNKFDDDETKSTLAQRRRKCAVPIKINATQMSRICYGDRDRANSTNIMSHKGPKDSISDLAKTFSTRTLLSPRDEPAREDKGVGKSSTETNEIEQIRNSLRSTANELEGIRNSLSSFSPVSMLIAERNKVAQSHCSENPFKKECRSSEAELAKMKSLGLIKSISLSHMERPASDGHASIRNPMSPCKWDRDFGPVRGKHEILYEHDSPDDFSNILARRRYGESLKAEDSPEQDDTFPPSFHSGRRNMHHGNLSFSDLKIVRSPSESSTHRSNMPYIDGRSITTSSLASGYGVDETFESNNGELLQVNSMTSEYTTDTEGDCASYGDNRYIQITLSSGGITEKFEPNVAMSPTVESSAPEGISILSPTDISIDRFSDSGPGSRRDKRKGIDPLKGAKNFFFGKNKKKSMQVEP